MDETEAPALAELLRDRPQSARRVVRKLWNAYYEALGEVEELTNEEDKLAALQAMVEMAAHNTACSYITAALSVQNRVPIISWILNGLLKSGQQFGAALRKNKGLAEDKLAELEECERDVIKLGYLLGIGVGDILPGEYDEQENKG
jgi:hypothetical protein